MQSCQISGLGQTVSGFGFGLALRQDLARGFDRGLLVLGLKPQDQVAGRDIVTLGNRQFRNDATGTQGQGGALSSLRIRSNADCA